MGFPPTYAYVLIPPLSPMGSDWKKGEDRASHSYQGGKSAPKANANMQVITSIHTDKLTGRTFTRLSAKTRTYSKTTEKAMQRIGYTMNAYPIFAAEFKSCSPINNEMTGARGSAISAKERTPKRFAKTRAGDAKVAHTANSIEI